MTNSELIDALRKNYISYFRLFDGQHGIRVHEDEEVAWIVANRPPGNHVLRANFDGPTAEERIDSLLRTLEKRTGGIRWLLFPADRPQDLSDRLARRGLATGKGDRWMFRSLHQLPRQETDGVLCVTQVAARTALRAWWTASARGFGMTQRAAQVWYDAYRRHGFGTDAVALNYCGCVDEETVTTGTMILAGGIAGIYDISTPPSFRRRGFASSLVSHLLAEAQRRGYSHAGLQTADSVALYRRLGFEVGFEEKEFFWTA